jgi:hypothetical protein
MRTIPTAWVSPFSVLIGALMRMTGLLPVKEVCKVEQTRGCLFGLRRHGGQFVANTPCILTLVGHCPSRLTGPDLRYQPLRRVDADVGP